MFGLAALLPLLLLAVGRVDGAVRDINGSCGVTKTCTDGLLIPAWQPVHNISTGEMIGRALIYFIAMAYMFLGVSIVADRFMAAIEVVTSKERVVVVKKKVTGEPYKILVRVWNETVSNLSLMALGSSAPEILLSVIEIFGNRFEAGELGPSTIVGSAAFNLFVIIAICVQVIPSTEVRRIKHIYVFWVTVSWSIFAYIWLYLILAVISPNVVEVWEGVLTFIFFPLTVLTAWLADRRMFGFFGQRVFSPGRALTGIRSNIDRTREGNNGHDVAMIEADHERDPLDPDHQEFEDHRNKYITIFRQLRSENPDAPIHYIEQLAEEKMLKEGPKSRAFYRIQATRRLVGAGDVVAKHHKKISFAAADQKKTDGAQVIPAHRGFAVVHFDPAHYTCLENVGTMYVTVVCDRSGLTGQDCIVEVDYKTVDGTANAGSDYKATMGTLTFNPFETRKNIGIEIVDNDIYEEDEQFLVQLSNVRATPEQQQVAGKDSRKNSRAMINAKVVAPATATVIIIDNDHAGAFGFEAAKFKVAESAGDPWSLSALAFRTHSRRRLRQCKTPSPIRRSAT
uniref:Calx-beta domain-containing protein n=1 Tax=Plectus sambesii TaxID=2011161 RepID=A0A914UTE9_9BILA